MAKTFKVYLEKVRGGKSKYVMVQADSRSEAAVIAESKHHGYVSCDEVLVGVGTAGICSQDWA